MGRACLKYNNINVFIMKKTGVLLLVAMVTALSYGCDERRSDAVVPPDIHIRDSYNVGKNDSLLIKIADTDNCHFVVTVIEDSILQAELTYAQGSTCIMLRGKEEGDTEVVIADSTAGEKYATTVVVTGSEQPLGYLALDVVESSHVLFKSGLKIFLVNDEANSSVYWNPAGDELGAERYGIKVEEDGILRLYLMYSAFDDHFTDAGIVPEIEGFDMSGSPDMLELLMSEGYIDGEVHSDIAGFDSGDYELVLKNDSAEIVCVVTDTELPEVIL